MQHDNKISLSQCSFCLEPPHPHPQLWFILQEEDTPPRPRLAQKRSHKKIVRNKISETFFPIHVLAPAQPCSNFEGFVRNGAAKSAYLSALVDVLLLPYPWPGPERKKKANKS